MSAENEREIYHKLEAMKDIRNKTITLERMKRTILSEVRSGDQEGRCLAQYKREMELLQQEKMSHVEELRQIHADINAMETVIKQTEESMSRKLSTASRLHEDYRPLKAEVDLLRRQCLGLERLPDLHEEEGSPVTPECDPLTLMLQMETVIKQTEESMSRKLSTASRLHEDYRPLKAEVDLLRRQCLGLERLPDLHEEEGSPVTPECDPLTLMLQMETVIKQTEESMSRKLSTASRLHEDYRPLKAEVDLLRRQCLGLERLPDLHEEEGSPITPDRFPALSTAVPVRAVPAFLPPAPPAHRKPPPHPPPPPPPPAFRQQPPPMKSCLSCHQQIHRNAPICPLCKAKSRSRNPKKPKKK